MISGSGLKPSTSYQLVLDFVAFAASSASAAKPPEGLLQLWLRREYSSEMSYLWDDFAHWIQHKAIDCMERKTGVVLYVSYKSIR